MNKTTYNNSITRWFILGWKVGIMIWAALLAEQGIALLRAIQSGWYDKEADPIETSLTGALIGGIAFAMVMVAIVYLGYAIKALVEGK